MLGPNLDDFFPRIGECFRQWHTRIDDAIKEINTRGRGETLDDNILRSWDNHDAILACKRASRAAMHRLLLTIDSSTQRGEDIAYGDFLCFHLLVPIVGGVCSSDTRLAARFEAVRGANVFKPAPGYEMYYHTMPRGAGAGLAPPPPSDRPAPASFTLRRAPAGPPRRGRRGRPHPRRHRGADPPLSPRSARAAVRRVVDMAAGRGRAPDWEPDWVSDPEEMTEEESKKKRTRITATLAPMRIECPVCRAPPSRAVQFTCWHVFCEGCAGDWLFINTSCPMCRRTVELSQVGEN